MLWIPKILEYRLFLSCFHFVISFLVIRMVPKCESCKTHLKKVASCQTCWRRKGDELASLQKEDLAVYWTRIPLKWRERFDHFEVNLKLVFFLHWSIKGILQYLQVVSCAKNGCLASYEKSPFWNRCWNGENTSGSS